jgi:hypothetical protein
MCLKSGAPRRDSARPLHRETTLIAVPIIPHRPHCRTLSMQSCVLLKERDPDSDRNPQPVVAIFAPIAISTANGGCNVDTTNFRATQVLGATGRQLICQVVLPDALRRHPVRDTNRLRRRLVDVRGGGACRHGARPPLHGAVATPRHRRRPCWAFWSGIATARLGLRALHRRLVPLCEKGD